jgi:hypothetical protein
VVTFLFTDIEGSTRRWESDADAMRASLLAHDKVLRTAIEENNGFLFSHTGDGVVAAFGSPISAVNAAIDADARRGSITAGGRVRLPGAFPPQGPHYETRLRHFGGVFLSRLVRGAQEVTDLAVDSWIVAPESGNDFGHPWFEIARRDRLGDYPEFDGTRGRDTGAGCGQPEGGTTPHNLSEPCEHQRRCETDLDLGKSEFRLHGRDRDVSQCSQPHTKPSRITADLCDRNQWRRAQCSIQRDETLHLAGQFMDRRSRAFPTQAERTVVCFENDDMGRRGRAFQKVGDPVTVRK